MHEINVKVIKYPDRRFLVMRYTDPLTGQHKSRSAKTNIRREAERAAAAWEAELHAGIVTHGKITWEAFRVRYENEVLASRAKTTFDKATGVLNSVEAIMKPMRLRDLTAERLSLYQAQLRTNGLAETTIAGMLAHLRAALQWAVNVGMLPVIPKIEKPKRAKSGKGMKGRPISGEEFDRMLDKTASVVGEAAADSWRHYLNGLWLSGLRLTESLELW